jgi:glycogen debranching enzyme
VRTLGAGEAGYNPLGYHTGTVWPHENSLIVAGLARDGHREQAVTIAAAMLAAAPHFEHRLPEVFAGYPAAVTSVPVAYPTASRPQAWAAGTPLLLLLTTLLGLAPGIAPTPTASYRAPSATSSCERVGIGWTLWHLMRSASSSDAWPVRTPPGAWSSSAP